MKFLRNLIASIFGSLIALGIFFLLFLLIIAAFGETDKVVVKGNSVLEISLLAQVKDYAPKSGDPIDEFLGVGNLKMGLNEIINAIENAKTDNNIVGISIRTLGVNAGIAQIQSIRKKLEEFKSSGKFIQAYADIYDQKSYYLSSVADSVYLNPIGAVDFKGLSSEVLFFKDFEDKTGVRMEVIRHGKYKSAVEPFIANEMSDDNRLQISSFLNSIWSQMLEEIAANRNTTIEQLNEVADKLLARNATLAQEHNIVDGAIYKDEYVDKMKTLADIDGSLNTISIANYISSGKGRIVKTGADRIAVIYAQGDIIYGKGNEDYIGQDLIIKALKKARKSSSVKGIVLRVDSPGGSALTSELIWRELELTKDEMPLVVSMGNVAASGGYYIACNADRIYAEPTTITGSIGVFGTIPNIHEFANDIGINAEQVHTNKGASYSLFEPMSDEFEAVAVEGVEQVYSTFLDRVSAGRNMPIEMVDELAQGRVWSGVEALDNGLIDALGTLDDAITYAADLAGIESYKIKNYPSYKVDFEDRFNVLPFAKSKEKILQEELGSVYYEMYQTMKNFTRHKGVQARMPFLMTID